MVYKVVEFQGTPRMKFSEEIGKITLPGPKAVVRVYGEKGPEFDLLCLPHEVQNLPEELTFYTEKNLESKKESFKPK